MQVLTEEELPEGKNKAIIHQNAGYASLCKQIHFIQINQICGIESSLFKCVGMIFSGVCGGENITWVCCRKVILLKVKQGVVACFGWSIDM